MNDISEAGLFRRELRDVRAVVANIDHRTRKLSDLAPPMHRPGGLTARAAFVAVKAFIDKREREDVAKQRRACLFEHDGAALWFRARPRAIVDP